MLWFAGVLSTYPMNPSWLFGLCVGTYIISFSLMTTGLEPIIRFDGVFFGIYLVSIIANTISLWQISNWLFFECVQESDLDRDIARYIEEPAQNDSRSETPLYDDNGDSSGHSEPLPNGGDGSNGDSIFL